MNLDIRIMIFIYVKIVIIIIVQTTVMLMGKNVIRLVSLIILKLDAIKGK